MTTKPKLQKLEVRLTEKLRANLIEHIKAMIEEVMGEQDIWRIIDEHVSEEYKREGVAWLEVDSPACVLCSIGSGDAVFRLPLDIELIDVDGPDAPQTDNRKRLKHLDVLIAKLQVKRQELSDAVNKAGG